MTGRLEVITSVERWSEIEADWRALYASAPNASPPLSWEWCTLWWEVYGPTYGHGEEPLRIACVWRDERLVAVLPLYLGRFPCRFGGTCLRFLSTGEDEYEETCADYMDLLCEPGEAEPALALLDTMLGSRPNCLNLNAVSAESPLVPWVMGLGSRGWWPRKASLGPSWLLDLSAGYDAWLAGLSKSTRRGARRSLDQSVEVGGSYLRATTTEQALAIYDALAELHQQRWEQRGKPGCFAAPRFAEFHRRLIVALGPERAVLSLLSLDGQPVAANYGFRVGNKIDCYQAGTQVDPDLAIKSPGIAGYMHLITDLAADGVTALDFLLGEAPHKDRLCQPRGELLRLTAAAPGVRAVLCHVRDAASQWRQRRAASRPAQEADALSDSP